MSASAANPLFSALDIESDKRLGENGHVEYGWSKKDNELFTQIYFQLVRAKSQKDTEQLRRNIYFILKKVENGTKEQFVKSSLFTVVSNLYKLIGHTRDIQYKGERQLAYAQIWVWYKFFPKLALHAVRSFVYFMEDNGEVNTSKHQYGSWNDIKYLCEAISVLNDGNKEHPIIDYAVSLIVEQLQNDIITPEGKPISLAARHAPREKGRFGWLFRKIAEDMYPYNTTARTSTALEKSKRKAWMHLRKNILSPLNKRLDTIQIKMAAGSKGEGEWDKINFNAVTSKSLRLYSKALQNKTKKNQQRTTEQHRIVCADNFSDHISKALSGDKTAKVQGKRCNTYELVKDVYEATRYGAECNKLEKIRINLQWKSNSENNKALGNMIAICDVSGSMTCDNCIPLYNAIGLAIRISEKALPAFQDRIITFSEEPTWVNLSKSETFFDKVELVSKAPWGMSTNIYKTFQLILNGILKSEMSPVDVSDLTIIVFSDMQINTGSSEYNDTLHENVVKMFAEAGMKSKYATPFSPPHLVWWNLRVTSGFPTLSTTKNCTMLSGYNASLLNAFESKGVDALKKYTPYKMICDILNEDRYNMLGNRFVQYFN